MRPSYIRGEFEYECNQLHNFLHIICYDKKLYVSIKKKLYAAFNSLVSSQALYHSADLMSHQCLSRKYKCRLFLMKYMRKKQRCPRRKQIGENHIHNCHFERYIVGYVCKSSCMAPLARRRKTKFSDRLADDGPPQMKILNAVIPCLSASVDLHF